MDAAVLTTFAMPASSVSGTTGDSGPITLRPPCGGMLPAGVQTGGGVSAARPGQNGQAAKRRLPEPLQDRHGGSLDFPTDGGGCAGADESLSALSKNPGCSP